MHRINPNIEIGCRAAAFVDAYVQKYGISYRAAMARFGFERKTCISWRNDGAPSAPALQAIALAAMSTTF